MDDVDLVLLRALQRDARQPIAELARQLRLASSAVFARVRKLEDAGVISGYHARLDARSFDRGLLAFVYVRTNERPNEIRAADALAALPDVLEVHHIAGEDCYLVKVRTRDAEALGRLIRMELGSVEGLVATRTTIVFETIKETNELPLPVREKGKSVSAGKERRRG